MKLFDQVVAVVFGVMMLVITIGLIIGVASLFLDIGNLLVEHKITAGYLQNISDLLTLYIMIKLFEQMISPEEIYALSALLLVLSALLMGSMLMHQRDTRLADELQKK